ncbi:MAG TPA: hypothetical protein VGS78_15125 [Candidatus Sulfotelmatobacter sp.]|nr:hypothetical protein [Candidatus Sulfotelmatobacter sp.]
MESSQKVRVLVFAVFLAILILFAIFYRPVDAESRPVDNASAAEMPVGKPIQIKAPLGLPPVPIPADNPPTAETIALGWKLYYDPVLSSDQTISCSFKRTN